VNRKELFEHHKEICGEALKLMEKKNHDYAGESGESPFANFTRSEDMGICTTEQGFLVRVCDKLSRLSTFTSSGTLKVDNESYQDAVVDIINYMVLFSGYLKDKNDLGNTSRK
tara:strand:+ start:347 stop:685 length:339 start_codon:yes stop_codon:yes gene_type:complete